MDIDRNAAATGKGDIQIAASPQTVYSVISAIGEWPSWNPDIRSVKLDGPAKPGGVFRWKSGPSTLTSTLEVVDPPQEIGWTGTTMGITARHVFRFEAKDGGTLARSEESWNGVLARLFRGYSRNAIAKAIGGMLSHLKVEAERRVAAGETTPQD